MFINNDACNVDTSVVQVLCINYKYTLKACDRVCGKKKGRRDQGDTWRWNEDVKEAIARKKDAHKEMRKSGTEANKARYKSMKNCAKEGGCKSNEGGG